jgi:Inner membrane component of T3SS, cytoplasmic domain
VAFSLTISEGRRRGRRFRFEAERISIGRGTDNDVVLNDAGVSRFHARIERRGAAWVLIDRGSANGTELNGAALAVAATLQDGDRIRLGKVTFEFRAGAEPGPGCMGPGSRLWRSAWWTRLQPPARAGLVAGCALVAVAGSGAASWRVDPPAAGASVAPDEPSLATGQACSEAPGAGPDALAAARAAYERGRRKLEERRIAPRNLFDAWTAFTQARAQLVAEADAPALRAELDRLIGDCGRDLQRQCGRLQFRASRFERYGQEEKAQQAWRELLLHFPGDDPTGCRKKAQANLLSPQPDVGGE